jgi:NADH:ubiquinone oxidoreductase subunit 5 (subunit L)/multisubunit Na+/H+ antiporter MnhA subunit
MWDEAYDNIIVRPFNTAAQTLGGLDVRYLRDGLDQGLYRAFNRLSDFLGGSIDLGVIDAMVNGAGAAAQRLAGLMRRVQTGYVRNYALGVLLGALVVLLILLLPVLLGQ